MSISVQTLLFEIKKICLKRHVHLTYQRLEVLRMISQQHNSSISAYNLLNLLRGSSLPNAKPSTIYRALNFLLDQGFIHRIESTNSFMLCKYVLELSHNFVFFICSNCKQVTEHIIKGVSEILQNTAQLKGFTMSHNVIETHGTCYQCENTLKH